MTPTALSIVMTTFPEGGERNKALGIWGSTGAIGGTAAWLVGGPITDGLGWEWIFFLNVPVAGVRGRPEPGAPAREPRDGRAAALRRRRRGDDHGRAGGAGLRGRRGARRPAGATPQTLGLLALAAVLIAAFAAHRVALGRTAGAAGRVPLAVAGRAATSCSSRSGRWPSACRSSSPSTPRRSSAGRRSSSGSRRSSCRSRRCSGPSPRRRSPRGAASGASRSSPWRSTGLGSLLLTQVSVGGSYLGDLFFALSSSAPGIGAAYVAGSIASLTGVAETEAGLASGLNNAVVPDRRRGGRGDPLLGRRLRRARRRSPGRADRRLPVRVRRGDRGRGARHGGGGPAARPPPRARPAPAAEAEPAVA